jgi:S-adenosylmethionine-dependent methyltransferase
VPDTRPRHRTAVRTAAVWAALRAELDRRAGAGPLAVLDAGGGTGGFAVPWAELGHSVTVVDPSPDSLAALARRAAEAGVADLVTARQGDLANLADVVAARSCDLVLCHSVLEVVDDPAAALQQAADALRDGGCISVLAANRTAAVFGRALAGHFTEARHVLDDPAGRWGAADSTSRRFALAELTALLDGAGLPVVAVYGVRIFADLVARHLLDADQAALDQLVELELAVADQPAFRDVATQLHMLGRRG